MGAWLGALWAKPLAAWTLADVARLLVLKFLLVSALILSVAVIRRAMARPR